MKKVFSKAGIRTARGRVVKSLNEAKKLIDETGYPVVAKPDIGVGAAQTYKINDFEELERFFAQKPPVDYIMEEYIQGQISTFDGLADQDGKLVFFASLQYSQGIMETVNEDSLIYYYTQRVIPADLEEAGRRTAKAFNVTERFFHFEFFRSSLDGELVALEVNMRPPGGLTTDMWNFSEDLDIYREWANVLVFNTFSAKISRKYHCCYVGRKFNRLYAHSHEQILDCFGSQVVHHELINGVFSAALGDYGYLVRSPDLGEIHVMAEYIQRPG
jgi:biotin carboxylase